jgi:two-component system sensor histidine kinase AlgZ
MKLGMIIKHLKLISLADTPSAVSSVIPDCCNIGVIYRVLLATNSAVFCAIWMRSADTPAAVVIFLSSAPVMETIAILSLTMLCGMRKVALIQHLPGWLQRLLCGLMPALIAVAVSATCDSQPWLSDELLRASALQLGVVSAFFGMLFQQHFELRARAFSPALGEAKLKALQARIRPHFLFNSINAVLSLIRTEPKRAETALEDLADLFRVLMRDTRDLSTLHEELQLCKQYLSIEKIRLGERLNVNWEIENFSDQDLHQGQIATLLLQPLIENAVHHGVEPAESPSLITIRINRTSERVAIVITNPYHPTHASKGNQMALDNIRERLTLLYDVESDFSAGVVDDQFKVKMSYPFQKISSHRQDRDPAVERRRFKRDDMT